MRYIAILTPDPDDGGFTVTFPDLPGCFTDGDTADAAIANAADALASHVAGMRRESMPVPAPSAITDIAAPDAGAVLAFVPLIEDIGDSVRVNLSLDRGVLAAIDAAAKARGATRSGFIAAAARQAILNS